MSKTRRIGIYLALGAVGCAGVATFMTVYHIDWIAPARLGSFTLSSGLWFVIASILGILGAALVAIGRGEAAQSDTGAPA